MASTTGQPPTPEQVQGWQQAFHSVAVSAVADVLASASSDKQRDDRAA